jgi:hypothetical protein
VNAITARSRFSMSVSAGMVASTWRICSTVGIRCSLLCGRHSHLVGGRVEIFCVGGVDPGLVSRLPGEPPEERFERAQDRRDRRCAQLLAGPGVRLLGKTGFERLGLLDVEVVEIAESGVVFEAMQRGRDRLKRRLAPAHRLPQEIDVCALDPLVRGLGLRHGVLSLSEV